jgi:hypothetical protein
MTGGLLQINGNFKLDPAPNYYTISGGTVQFLGVLTL